MKEAMRLIFRFGSVQVNHPRNQRKVSVLAIEKQNGGGYLLLRFDASGVCIGDTWHLTVDEAKSQAEFEFATNEATWSEEFNSSAAAETEAADPTNGVA